MKTRPVIGFSLALNVALAAAIFLSVKESPTPAHAPMAKTPVPSVNPQSPPPADSSPPPGLPFRWSQIASEDLKTYRDNLRAIGCPELTVREIMRAVINELFGPRRRSILTSFQERYWDMVLDGELVRRQWIPRTEYGHALSSLVAERQQLIADVLGQDTLTAEFEQTQRANLEQKRSWLSPQKREKLIELEDRHQQHLAKWAESVGSRVDGIPTAEDQDRLQKWQQEFAESKKQLLTQAELDELNLRESDVADWAGGLPGFNPTEDEWRSLTGLRSQYEESQRALANPDLTDDERMAQQKEAQANFDNAVQTALDPDRFAQYQLANNDQYQVLHNVTQRYGLPDSVADQGLSVQQSAQTAAAQVRANPNLSLRDAQFLGNFAGPGQPVFDALAEQLVGGQLFPRHMGLGFIFGFEKVPFQRRTFGLCRIAIFHEPHHELCPALNFASVFCFGQLHHPKCRVFTARGAAHETVAPGVGDKNNGNAIAPHFQEPRQNHFPVVGVVLLDSTEQAREIIQEKDFNSFAQTVRQQCSLHREESQVQDLAGQMKQRLVLQVEHSLGRSAG